MAEKERHCVEAMVDFLKSRKAVIDFGVYPQEYTSLHFVALGYFVDRLRTSQKAIIGELESSESDLAGDMEAVNLIESILDTERDIVKQLEELKVSAA